MSFQVSNESPVPTHQDVVVTVDDDTISVSSAQTPVVLSEPEARICTRRQIARMSVSLFVGLVAGWCAIGAVALVNTERSEIREICNGSNLWELLLLMVVSNAVCTFIVVHTWYHHHYHHRKPYKHSSKVLLLIALIQAATTLWGATIIFSSCPSEYLRPFLLYTVVYIWVLWQLIVIAIIAIIALCVCLSSGAF